jgi:hypothetical protein
MDNYRLNLYEIEDPGRFAFDYRLVEVQGLDRATVSNPDLVDQNLNILAKLVAIREKCPVSIVHHSGQSFLAVPAGSKLEQLEYNLAPDIAALVPQSNTHQTTLMAGDPLNRRIAVDFLRFCLRGPLWGDRELWSSGPQTFFCKGPVNGHEISRQVDLYEGFHFHIRYLDGKLFVGIKLSYKYVDVAWATDRFSREELRRRKMRMFLYHFGDKWYPVQLLECLDKSIRDVRFVPEDTGEPISVFDYTVQKAGKNPPPWIRGLDPESPAILYRYPGRAQRLHAALALAKLIHRTDDAVVGDLHRRSIKSPDDRFRFSRRVIERYFQGQKFFGSELSVSQEAYAVRPRFYPVPPLEFGQKHLLTVGTNVDKCETPLRDLGRTRINLLLDHHAGAAITSPLEPQYALIPQSLDRAVASDVSRRLEAVTRTLLQTPYRFDTVLFDDRNARTLKQHVDAILAGVEHADLKHGRGVLILPAHAHDDLHNYVKRALRNRFEFQCIDAARLTSFYQTVLRDGQGQVEVKSELEGRYTSYLRYVALGLLIVNRQWGWVLKEGTHYDAYICIDVLNQQAAFTFFYEGGRQCYVRSCDSKQPGKHERLSRKQVRAMVYEGLKTDLLTVAKPRSIVLQRDGRLFRREWLGFEDAVRQLIDEGLLDAGLFYGGFEIAKKFNAGMRLVHDRNGRLENPRIGTAYLLGTDEGIVCTTGFPFPLRGTASPLAIRIYEGSMNLDWVMEDVFRKSLLAWSAPDHCLSVPIDLKLCDEFLRAFAADADEEEALYGEQVEETVEAV